jgi:hypothetical protein
MAGTMSANPAAIIILVHFREKRLVLLVGQDPVTVGIDSVLAEPFEQPGLMPGIEWWRGMSIVRPRCGQTC